MYTVLHMYCGAVRTGFTNMQYAHVFWEMGTALHRIKVCGHHIPTGFSYFSYTQIELDMLIDICDLVLCHCCSREYILYYVVEYIKIFYIMCLNILKFSVFCGVFVLYCIGTY